MYETFFGLARRPFAAEPAADRYFPAAGIEAARVSLARCVERNEGIGLVIGAAGVGKSLLCRMLAEQFRGRFQVALLASGRLASRRALLQAILFAMGLPCRGMDEAELQMLLSDRLSADQASAGLLLIVDEADSLSARMLEELRLLLNLGAGEQSRVRLLVVGGRSLEERLSGPRLESFNQRIRARCYVQPLAREETLALVRHEITQAGGDADRIFSADALDAIHRATEGTPRLVNQLCDHALLLAYAGGVGRLDAAGIEEALFDLQQLPAPAAAQRAGSESADIIEFGALDDAPPPRPLPFASESPRQLRAIGPEEDLLAEGEPAEQIRRIEEQLEAIDAGQAPPRPAAPEVELVFPAAENPFQESFAEEELVVDRFAAARNDALVSAPAVHSAEGRELGARLRICEPAEPSAPTSGKRFEAPPRGEANIPLFLHPLEERPAPERPNTEQQPPETAPADPDRATDADWRQPAAHFSDEWESDEPPPDEQPLLPFVRRIEQPIGQVETPSAAPLAGELNPADDPVMPEPEPRRNPLPDTIIDPPPVREFAPVELPRTLQIGAEDVILVEDDPPQPPSPPQPPDVTPAGGPPRRPEYRQLFARLRKRDG